MTKINTERALIDQLIAATRLYNSSDAIKALFTFTQNLQESAPFNAMLLHIQKPGLTHAATARAQSVRSISSLKYRGPPRDL